MEMALQGICIVVFCICMWKTPDSYSLVLFLLGGFMGLATWYLQAGTPEPASLVDQLLSQIVSWFIGVGGFVGFVGHTFMAEKVAASIGWERSPFQFEVACTSLAFGVLGFMTSWFQGGFLAATAVGWSVFLLGAFVGHIREIVKKKNFSPNNAGVIFYMDFMGPVGLLTLLGIKYL